MGTDELSGKPTKCWGVTCDGLASHPGGVAILLVASCYRNRDKLRLCGPLSSCADITHGGTTNIMERLASVCNSLMITNLYRRNITSFFL